MGRLHKHLVNTVNYCCSTQDYRKYIEVYVRALKGFLSLVQKPFVDRVTYLNANSPLAHQKCTSAEGLSTGNTGTAVFVSVKVDNITDRKFDHPCNFTTIRMTTAVVDIKCMDL